MGKLDQTFKESAESHPDEKFNVLIVVKEGADLKKLRLNHPKKLMDNILSASLEGREVVALAQEESVVSIEKDQEMGIM